MYISIPIVNVVNIIIFLGQQLFRAAWSQVYPKWPLAAIDLTFWVRVERMILCHVFTLKTYFLILKKQSRSFCFGVDSKLGCKNSVLKRSSFLPSPLILCRQTGL